MDTFILLMPGNSKTANDLARVCELKVGCPTARTAAAQAWQQCGPGQAHRRLWSMQACLC